MTVQDLCSTGGWCWFADPRAIYQDGKTTFGYLNRNGDVVAAQLDHASGVTATFTLHAGLEVDDHDNPTFLHRASDGRILAFYSRHAGQGLYCRLATNPNDISAWGPEVNLDSQLGGYQYTYPSPIQRTGAPGQPIDLFYRQHDPDGQAWWARSTSLDGGVTWGAQQKIIHYTYSKRTLAPDGARIDFVFDDGPQWDPASGVSHMYTVGDHFYASDGTPVDPPVPVPSGRWTSVYAGNSSAPAWVWDVAHDASGKPVCTFAKFLGNFSDHRAMYGRWTGSTWQVTEICPMGPGLYGAQPWYSGGAVIDHEDVNVVYVSRQVAGQWEIWRYRTTDGGLTFTGEAVTAGSAVPQLRPVVIRDHPADAIAVLWCAGRYTTYTDYDQHMRGATGADVAETPPEPPVVLPQTVRVGVPAGWNVEVYEL